ncbi:MAG TPA: caspase family protein [Xanthobacteraceae bacterium]
MSKISRQKLLLGGLAVLAAIVLATGAGFPIRPALAVISVERTDGLPDPTTEKQPNERAPRKPDVAPSSGTIREVGRGRRSIALVIGLKEYRHAPKLETSINDAEALSQKLATLGFDVLLGLDLDLNKLNEIFETFAKRLNESDAGLLFFAGHGVEVSGRNYVIPVDARVDKQDELALVGLPLDKLLSVMESSAPTRILLVDACRDDPFALKTRSLRSAIGRGLAPMKSASNGTYIGFATAPGAVALDSIEGKGNHSPFTAALLKHLDTPGLEIEQLFREVRKSVLSDTQGRQVPWSHSSLIEPFYFVPPRDVVASRRPNAGEDSISVWDL